MHKHYAVIAVYGALAACGVVRENQEPAGIATTETTASASSPVVPVKTVELGDRQEDSQRSCESLTRPGSRIVVAQRCRSVDEEALADQLGQVRREQDELDRLAREREAQRRGF